MNESTDIISNPNLISNIEYNYNLYKTQTQLYNNPYYYQYYYNHMVYHTPLVCHISNPSTHISNPSTPPQELSPTHKPIKPTNKDKKITTNTRLYNKAIELLEEYNDDRHTIYDVLNNNYIIETKLFEYYKLFNQYSINIYHPISQYCILNHCHGDYNTRIENLKVFIKENISILLTNEIISYYKNINKQEQSAYFNYLIRLLDIGETTTTQTQSTRLKYTRIFQIKFLYDIGELVEEPTKITYL